MRTFELFIVFAALMALIAVVGIGIDWIGKPLRGRRFIPRIYRYDDEKAPLDGFGRPINPVPVAPPATPQRASVARSRGASRRVGASRARRPAATAAAVAAPSAGAFSASLVTQAPNGASTIATANGADVTAASWHPGMALDARVADRKPTPAVKASRFWRTIGQSGDATHFDAENLGRMASGKPPHRYNPRLGRYESMQLVGLRQASTENDVRMNWPDEAVDPWSSQ